jgi:tRNA(adenine34) deaminase
LAFEPEQHGDAHWMALALEEAQKAYAEDEVPIGAVIIGPAPGADESEDVILLGRGRNATRSACDVSAHAEVLAIRAAAQKTGYMRLEGCTLFTTIEPCFMCAGAALHARLRRVVFGAPDPKFGGTVSLGRVFDTEGLNHRVLQQGGVCAEEARKLMQDFFRSKRKSQK